MAILDASIMPGPVISLLGPAPVYFVIGLPKAYHWCCTAHRLPINTDPGSPETCPIYPGEASMLC